MDRCIIQEHIDTINTQLHSTRAQCIRATIFPESIEDRFSSPISSSTQSVNGQATAVQKCSEPLHTLAKKEASGLALSSLQMIQVLIQAISNPRANDEIHRGVADVLHCLSKQKPGLLVIFKGSGITLLVKLLE